MIVRRGPAIVLSLALSAAALSGAPALAVDGGAAKVVERVVERDNCDPDTPTRAKLKVEALDGNSTRLLVTSTVWTNDDDVWLWKLKHNDEVSDDGRARGGADSDVGFRVIRLMLNFPDPDDVVFRAENQRTGEVCRVSTTYLG